MEFNIVNANLLLSQAGQIGQLNQNIARCKESLSNYYGQINAAWQSDTDDKKTYLNALSKQLDKMSQLNSALTNFSNALTSFAEKAIQESNK